MSNLKIFKKAYDRIGNDHVRGMILDTAERLRIPKDVVRMDTNCICNVRCIMCNQRKASDEKEFMSFDQFKSIMDIFASNIRMLYLSCAYEPLLTPNFTEYLKYAKSKKIPYVSFCTNAMLMNDKVISCLVDNKIDEIIISFNGFCEEDYNRIMKGSDFKRVCQNIRALNEYKKITGVTKPHIRLNTILLKSNVLHLEKMMRFLIDYQIDTIQFRELVVYESQNDPAQVQKELLSNLSMEAYQEITSSINEMVKLIRDLGKEFILPVSFGQSHPSHQKEESESDNQSINIQKECVRKKSCSIPCFSKWIDWTGNIRVCGYDEQGIIGNALHHDLLTLKEKRKQFRRLALAGECSSELCTMNIDSSTIL